MPRRVYILLLSGLLLAAPSLARAEPLQSQYLKAYLKINDADELEKQGDLLGALADFKDAYSRLQKIHNADSSYETALVVHRMDDCRVRIVDLTNEVAARMPSVTPGARESAPNLVPAPAEAEDVTALKLQLSDVRKQLEDMKAKYQNSQIEVTTLHSQIETVNEQLAALKNGVSEDSKMGALLDENKALTEKLATAQKQISSIRSLGPRGALTLARAQLKNAQDKLDASEAANTALQQTTSTLRQQLDQAQADLTAANQKLAAAPPSSADYDTLKRENEVMRDILRRELQEQAHRDMAKRLMQEEFDRLRITSTVLREQLDILGSPMTPPNSEQERTLLDGLKVARVQVAPVPEGNKFSAPNQPGAAVPTETASPNPPATPAPAASPASTAATATPNASVAASNPPATTPAPGAGDTSNQPPPVVVVGDTNTTTPAVPDTVTPATVPPADTNVVANSVPPPSNPNPGPVPPAPTNSVTTTTPATTPAANSATTTTPATTNTISPTPPEPAPSVAANPPPPSNPNPAPTTPPPTPPANVAATPQTNAPTTTQIPGGTTVTQDTTIPAGGNNTAAATPAPAPPPADTTTDYSRKPRLPNDMRDTAQEAADYFKNGRYDEAADKYQNIIDKYPDSLYAWSNLGVVRFQQGKLPEALKALQRAVKLSPTDAFSYSNLGIVYYQMNQYENAIAALERALALDPSNAKSHNYLGCACSQKGWQEVAEKEFLKAIELDDTFGDAHFNLALVYATEKPPSLEMARRHYKRALELGIAQDPRLEKLLRMEGGVGYSPAAAQN